MFAQMPDTLLRRATIVHADVTHEQRDVRIVEGVIAEVSPPTLATGSAAHDVAAGDRTDVDTVLELEGWLLLPAAVEPHAHLDKAFLAEQVDNPVGDLLGAIDAMIAAGHTITIDDTIRRAERAARLMARHGYTAVRSHVDVTTANELRSVEALLEVRRRVADVIDVELVALAGSPVVGDGPAADQRALLRESVAMGVDLVGGCPHLEEAGTAAATDVLLSIAAELGVGVDLHTDETLDPTVDGLSELCRAVLAGFGHPATASHCVSLGMRSADEQRRTADLVAEAGVGVVTLPHTNLYLLGRGHAPMPRGLTALAALRAAGATVAAGADNLQDPFNPVGRACPFETAGLMITAGHLLPGEAWEAVSGAARHVLGRAVVTIEPGAPADLLAVRATTLREAIAMAPPERLVWRRGALLEGGPH